VTPMERETLIAGKERVSEESNIDLPDNKINFF
jgi:hypothetical protein